MLSHGFQHGNNPLAPPPARAPLDLVSVLVYTLREGRGETCDVCGNDVAGGVAKQRDRDRQ